jgi:uncharacterized repeat protein (TIGR01451 family)
MASARTGRLSAIAAAVAAVLLAPAAPAAATTFTVNTEADPAGPGCAAAGAPCSLRQAVAAAAASTVDPADTIQVPAGRYVLSQGQLTVTGSSSDGLVVQGAGAATTVIDAAGASRVLNAQNGTVTVRDVTITGGQSTFDPLSGNQFTGDGAGIIATSATLNVERSVVSGNTAQLNGGGIAAPPENVPPSVVNITDSTIAANKVTGGMAEGQGGGIYVAGDLRMTNSTVSGNTVDNPGANSGGGVAAILAPADMDGSTVNLLNTTIASNSLTTGAGGGLGTSGPTVAITARNTIVADNQVGGTEADCTPMAVATSASNLSGDASCGFSDAGSAQNANPQLAALADNGGPTPTRAPAPGSPAVETGTNTDCPATDQRGVTRPQGATCDIGAVERVLSADLTVARVDGPASAEPNTTVTYAVTVRNNGPDRATGVRVTYPVPAGLELLSQSGATDCGGSPLVCSLPDLASGDSRAFSVTVRTSGADVVTNRFTAGGSLPDPDGANNAGSAQLTVATGLVTPRLSQKASVVKLSRGRFRVSIRGRLLNTGSKTCGGIVLADVKVKTRRAILRNIRVGSNCRYARKITFSGSRIPRKLRARRKQSFKVVGRYTGTSEIKSARAITNIRSKK